MSKDAVTIVNGIGNGRQNRRHPRKDPVYKVMLIFCWEFELVARSKDCPAGGQHGIHGRSGRGKEFNQGSNSDRRQGLLDNVMVFSKVELPIELQLQEGVR